MKLLLGIIIIFSCTHRSFASEEQSIQTELKLEYGFLAVLNHRIQLSEDNTHFDYVKSGGQDVLFEQVRYTGSLIFSDRDRLLFVAQPLDLVTRKTLEDDLVVENETFAAGTPMNFRYSFTYYRATYLWSLISSQSHWMGLGGGLQIRNATIEFWSVDGSKHVSNRDIGPVPLFALHYTYKIEEHVQLYFEAEGNYADTQYINGDTDSAVKGAIFDSAVSMAIQASERFSALLSARYISGGAEGKSDEKDNPNGDGYNSNWIDLFALTSGLIYKF